MLIFVTTLANLFIGFLVGTTGIGGILLPPMMVELLGLPTHLAMGTSLASFFLPTVLGSWLHARAGHVDWAACVAVGGTGLVCTLLGTELKARLSATPLNLLLAGLILYAGFMAFRPVAVRVEQAAEQSAEQIRKARRKLMWLGGAVGVASGLTGAGGPVLTVPGMIVLGYSPLVAIGVGQVYSVLVSVSGTVGNALHGAVDVPLALGCSVGQMLGVWLGVRAARHLNTAFLKKLVASVCVSTGIFILARTLIWN